MQDIGGGPAASAARGTRAQGSRSAAARVLLQADPRRRVLPRGPASREPDVAAGGGDAVLPRPRHDRRGRPRPARAHDAAADGVLAAGRRVPDRRHAHAHGGDQPDGPGRRGVPGGARRAHGEEPRRVAEGDPARSGPAGDDRDRAPPRRGTPGVAHADREGARADAARGVDARSGYRPVRRRGQVPDAERGARDGEQAEPDHTVLPGPALQGSLREGGRGDRATDRRPPGAEARGELPSGERSRPRSAGRAAVSRSPSPPAPRSWPRRSPRCRPTGSPGGSRSRSGSSPPVCCSRCSST